MYFPIYGLSTFTDGRVRLQFGAAWRDFENRAAYRVWQQKGNAGMYPALR